MGASPPSGVVLLAAFSLCVGGCGGTQAGLAKVGDSSLEIESFQVYLEEASGQPWPGVSARVASKLLDQYLERQVVIEAAARREILTNGELPQLGPSEMRWLLRELCGPPPEPSTEDVEREVKQRLVETLPAQAHVRQILVDSLEQAELARQRLAEGVDFVTVSREMSRAPNAMDGGELGTVFEGSLPEEVDRVVFSLSSGEISDPVEGQSGYHVFQVLEMIPAGPPDMSAAESSARMELTEQRAREHTRRCIEDLVSEVGVEVVPSSLWFAYDGKYGEGRVDG